MDDKFLYQNRPPVRQGFGENLYARISNLPVQQDEPRRKIQLALRFTMAVILLFAALITFSQPVRAGVLYLVKQIAGFEIQEDDYIPVTDGGSVSIPPDMRDSLVNIAKALPYQLAVPAYVPEGFVFENKVEVQDTSVFMRWLDGDRNEILMLVDTDHGQRYVTGADAAREIQINGQSALLIQGNYDIYGNWDPSQKMLNLIQRQDDLIYWLIYIQHADGEFNSDAGQNELARMMSSLVGFSVTP